MLINKIISLRTLCEEYWHWKVYRGTSIEKERQLRIESGLIRDILKNCFRGRGGIWAITYTNSIFILMCKLLCVCVKQYTYTTTRSSISHAEFSSVQSLSIYSTCQGRSLRLRLSVHHFTHSCNVTHGKFSNESKNVSVLFVNTTMSESFNRIKWVIWMILSFLSVHLDFYPRIGLISAL